MTKTSDDNFDLPTVAVACDDDINALLDRMSGLELKRLINEVRAAREALLITLAP